MRLRSIRINRLCTTLLFGGAAVAKPLPAQSATLNATPRVVPIAELAPVDAKTTLPFGNVFGVRPMVGNGLLVNDGVRRQLVALDATFSKRTVVLDSAAAGGSSYGQRATPFIPYLGDSTLFVDVVSASILVIDPTGKIVRVMSAPKAQDIRFMANAASGTDSHGNLIYRGVAPIPSVTTLPSGEQVPPRMIDSAPLLRANFDTRAVDTIAKIKIVPPRINYNVLDGSGNMRRRTVINPLSSVDDWTVLSNGTLAIVRGGDYHVEYLAADGKLFTSPKLPFDWKRISEDEKRAMLDTMRKEIMKEDSTARASAAASPNGATGTIAGVAVRRPTGPIPPLSIEDAPLGEIADYYPSVRTGATKPDLDGNLWILPATSAQSTAGELVYDVVNNKGELFQRVRITAGRSIAGFGHNGVVYLMYRDAEKGWFLERTRVDTKKVKQ